MVLIDNGMGVKLSVLGVLVPAVVGLLKKHVSTLTR